MTNKNLNKLISIIAVFACFVAGGMVLAQSQEKTTESVSGSSGAGVTVNATVRGSVEGFTVLPLPEDEDEDRRTDIAQLNNLVIQKIDSSGGGTIYASRSIDNSCYEYSSVQSQSATRVYPCPLAPSVLYQIEIQSDTVLMLKTRVRATIEDFEIGDRINVFGFIESQSGKVEALIVRDLDKPYAPRYIQLNNLTVVSQPGQQVPTSLKAVRFGPEVCLSFDVSTKGASIACPAGELEVPPVSGSVEKSLNSSSVTLVNPDFRRPAREVYTINVSATTRLLNLNRGLASVSDLQEGDKINVYGLYRPAARAVDAVILRDLSPSRQPGTNIIKVTSPNGGEVVSLGDTFPIRWTLGESIETDSTLVISLVDGPSQGVIATLSAQDIISREHGWNVRHVLVGGDAAAQIEPGSYRIKMELYDGRYCSGFCATPQNPARIVSTDFSDGYFRIGSSGDEPDGAPEIFSARPNEGSHGQIVALRGENFAGSGNYVYLDGYIVARNIGSRDGETLSFEIPEYVSYCNQNPYNSGSGNQACALVALKLNPGEYSIQVVNAGGSSNKIDFDLR